MSNDYQPVMSLDELTSYMDSAFPQVNMAGQHYFIDGLEPGVATMRLETGDIHLRPGGTVSGPAMFTLADYAAYAVILGHIGPMGLAVTTNLNINFLRKPEPGTIVARGQLMKLGKRLAVVDIGIFKPDDDDLLAHATATYSIPPKA